MEFVTLDKGPRRDILDSVVAPVMKNGLLGSLDGADAIKGSTVDFFCDRLTSFSREKSGVYPRLASAVEALYQRRALWDETEVWEELVRYFRELHDAPGWPLSMGERYSGTPERKEALRRLVCGEDGVVFILLGGLNPEIYRDDKDIAADIEKSLLRHRPSLFVTIGYPEEAEKAGVEFDSVAYPQWLREHYPFVRVLFDYAEKESAGKGRTVVVLLGDRMQNHYILDLEKSPFYEEAHNLFLSLEPLHCENQEDRIAFSLRHPEAIAFEIGWVMKYLLEMDSDNCIWGR